MTTFTRVIGIGSRYGDDCAGWLAAARLAAVPGVAAEVIAVRNPIEILDNIIDCQRLIVVDAARSDRLCGQVRRFRWPTVSIEISASHSSHGVGVAYALQLAQQRALLPGEVVVFAIECRESPSAGGAEVPSEQLLIQVYEAVRRIRAEIELECEDANA